MTARDGTVESGPTLNVSRSRSPDTRPDRRCSAARRSLGIIASPPHLAPERVGRETGHGRRVHHEKGERHPRHPREDIAPPPNLRTRHWPLLGDRTALTLAAALAGIDAASAVTAASALVRADLLRYENPLEFTHPVVRSAVLEQMDGVERTRAHRQAAALLLDGDALPEQAATYLMQALPSGDRFVDSILDTCSTSMGLGTEVLVAASNGQSGLPLTSVFPSDEQLDSCFKSRYLKDCSSSLVFLLVTMMSHYLLLSHTRY